MSVYTTNAVRRSSGRRPPYVLRVKQSPEYLQALSVAQNPQSSVHTLAELYWSYSGHLWGDAVHQALAENPNTPLRLLIRLIPLYPQEFLRNSALPLLLLENPTFFAQLPHEALIKLSSSRYLKTVRRYLGTNDRVIDFSPETPWAYQHDPKQKRGQKARLRAVRVKTITAFSSGMYLLERLYDTWTVRDLFSDGPQMVAFLYGTNIGMSSNVLAYISEAFQLSREAGLEKLILYGKGAYRCA